MKKLALFVALLFCCQVSHAGPINWVKHHQLASQLIFAGVSAGVYAEGLHQCRIPNVENCQAHYGAAWASYGTTVGLDFLGVFVGHKIGGKVGNSIAYGGSTIMLGWGAYQWHGGLNKPNGDWKETGKPDLSTIEILH